MIFRAFLLSRRGFFRLAFGLAATAAAAARAGTAPPAAPAPFFDDGTGFTN